ncbi:PEP-CTERM system histidine kinase PrsK [Sphingomonas aliaeris]|uniref:histidine kinase n=1 Tax=Sphingomonas aliaeris TaxID=2759526 RepID=A0A974NWG6_9SPHN|nr:XrtA/PEP-CTERM system histidine kinase PrsK [Sphingomonas aliaeris]QQV78052.1 PEP-CTERM system histidine kinase PrsK [Sphingomonas aliaeris]
MPSLSFWSVVLSTIFYAGLAIWRLLITRRHPRALHLGLAFTGMALWSASMLSGVSAWMVVSEPMRDAGWLAYIVLTTRTFEQDDEARRTIRRFCISLGVLIVVRTALSLLIAQGGLAYFAAVDLTIAMFSAHWVFALVGVAFAHFLYRASASASASGFRLIVIALGVLWAYNLNLYTLMLLGYPLAVLLLQGMGVLALGLVPALALAARRKERWKVTLSRQATTRSLLFVAIGSYFVVISAATRALIWAGGHGADLARLLAAVILALTILAIGLLPKLRARVKAMFVRHLFEHRYDYRSEWLRFSATIADRTMPNLSAEERAIRSVADVTESLGGVLLFAERGERMALAGCWQWYTSDPFSHALPVEAQWLDDLAHSGRILNLDEIRETGGSTDEDRMVPDWLLRENKAWVVVPLARSGRLVGIIVLGRPQLDRDLDWEDFDLLRVISQQVAVHLTDAQNQAELDEARRFEEFNRRFGFIIHDLKNVVSQLSLVSSNAAQHGANPKFQAAMAKTLENATGKMTTMLSRLSTERSIAEPQMVEVDLTRLLTGVAQHSYAPGVVILSIEQDCVILADAEQLSIAIEHLITNAIEASPPNATVAVSLTIWDGVVVIAVEDKGEGMTPEFIRKELFKPFASTKKNGFGIGAAEARSLVIAMGGDMEVISVKGSGSRFALRFPLLRSSDDDGI